MKLVTREEDDGDSIVNVKRDIM